MYQKNIFGIIIGTNNLINQSLHFFGITTRVIAGSGVDFCVALHKINFGPSTQNPGMLIRMYVDFWYILTVIGQ